MIESIAVGEQVRVVDPTGTTAAVIAPLAGSLRRLTVEGEHLVEPTDHSTGMPGMAGATLAPWPNRVEDARWWLAGRPQDLDVTESELGNANHGLLAGRRFDVVGRSASAVELATTLRHAAGYPFELRVSVRYEVDREGITITTRVHNEGRDAAPVALGAHPYVRLGDTPVDQLLLTVDATHAYRLDSRHIPRERFAIDHTMEDLRMPKPVSAAPGHATFVRDGANGMVTHRLRDDRGRTLEVWAEDDYRWTQLYRADSFPGESGRKVALALEPMTAPPNALRTGEGLRWLAPTETWQVGWGIRLKQGRAPNCHVSDSSKG